MKKPAVEKMLGTLPVRVVRDNPMGTYLVCTPKGTTLFLGPKVSLMVAFETTKKALVAEGSYHNQEKSGQLKLL